MKENKRKELYKKLITLHYEAQAGHIGSSLSCLDILIFAFTNVLGRNDKFILSKGHGVPALYIVLNHIGKISDRRLSTFHKNETSLPAHPPNGLSDLTPFPSGSLGHGLSISAGVAHGYKIQTKNKKDIKKVFCLISDGECNEGQIWEAAQYAVAKKLNNLVAMVDNNGIQAFGNTKEVLGDSTHVAKWKAFGFETYSCDGHNYKDMKKVFSEIKKSENDKPKVIIFKTVKGHGVSFMENKIEWHYYKLDQKLYEEALLSIDKKIGK